MTRRHTRVLTILVALGLTLSLAGGCSNPFAPPGGGGGGGGGEASYRDRLSPGDVLHNLDTAYEYKNAEEYLACLAEDFIFYTAEADQNNPEEPLPEDWDKQTERIIHENMFGEDTDVDRITLTLTNQGIEYDPGADPVSELDDRYSYVEGVDLRVYIPIPGDDLILLATANNMFVFQVDPNEVGPNGENLWEVKEWHDLDDARRAIPGQDDPLSVGRLKAEFLE
jgi:hypothetical protein